MKEEDATRMFEDIYQAIQRYDTIIIHRHCNPDPDAIGSQKGLAVLIEHQFPNKKILCVGDPFPLLAHLAMMDEVTESDYEGALVIVLDTANRPRIDGDLYHKGAYLIKIDHHPVVDQYGDVSLVCDQASSVSQIVTELSQYLGQRLPMTDAAAELLYAGIVADTGRFLYGNTSVAALKAATFLRTFDFSATDLCYAMIEKPSNVIQLLGYAMEHVRVSPVGVAHVLISQELLQQFGLTDSDTAALIAFPGEIKGVICWGIFVEQPNGHYRARLRSKGPAINDIAEQFRGGGHRLASGATAEDLADIGMLLSRFEERASDWRNQVPTC